MPIHFLWGDEDYLIERTVKKIKKDVLKDDVNELNYKAVDKPSFSLFSELIRTNAMMFGDVVIQIKCANFFLETKDKEKIDEKETLELVNGLKNVSDRVHLILICETPKGEKKKPDSRKKLYKELIKITTPQEFSTFRNYEETKVLPFVKKMADELKIKISTNDILTLIRTSGTYLRDLYNQLEKLKLFAYPKDTVTSEMIKEIATSKEDLTIFMDLVLQKKYSTALNLIAQILQREEYAPSLAFVQANLSSLVKTKIYSSKLSKFDIAAKLGVHPFIVEKNLEKVAKISLEDLVNLKINFTNAEYQLKSGMLKDALCAYELALFNKVGEVC